ncbi:glycosyltransferase [Shewanella baltica]|uniref:glycosyltransferase n=1 Tax=Shewanella baltica TaxID=62322 RepID=UPI0021689DB5|nr:glycosyltransferase [Shewanella baltica]MCS6113301.1 glycosyltransferase [Shewanella baltica]UVW64706.1 glycosyltransferase [Shewanella baltica]
MKKAISRRIAFVSMSSRDSAMWFSYMGLKKAIDCKFDNVDFFFPTNDQDKHLENEFYYDLSSPIRTLISVLTLSRSLCNNYSSVFVFSQGIFSAFLTLLIGRRVDVYCWGHEFDSRVKRAGLLRGINYLISDYLMSFFVKKIFLASKPLIVHAQNFYSNEKVFYSPLPLSGDFNSDFLKFDRNQFRKMNFVKIVFFGGVTKYKGLDTLCYLLDSFKDSEIELVILGRGELADISPGIYKRFLEKRNVTWYNDFVSSDLVANELIDADFMYVMYDSVTATSQVDIANSLGVPVLASNLPFFKEKVLDGINGYVLEGEDVVDFFVEYLNSPDFISRDEIFKYFHSSGVNSECVSRLNDAGVFN